MNIKPINSSKRSNNYLSLNRVIANLETHALSNEKLSVSCESSDISSSLVTISASNFSQSDASPQTAIISVAGANGKTIVAQMIGCVFSRNGGAVKTKSSENQNEWSDVSIITNIQPNANQQCDSENNRSQIEFLITKLVRENQTLILNADDELSVQLGNDPRIVQSETKIIYFSLKLNHLLLRRHILAGQRVYTIKNNWLIEIDQARETRILEISDVPATFNGAAEFNVANLLAAVAVCRTQNMSAEQIASALRSFQVRTQKNNLFNFYEVDGAYIFFDQTSNYEAFKAVCQMAANLDDGERRVSSIFGFSSDLSRDLLQQIGRLAAQSFDRITVREHHNLDGHTSDAAAQTLYQAIEGAAFENECRIISSENEALRREITRLREDDILICFYEDAEVVEQILKMCEAIPTLKLKKANSRSSFNLRQA